MLASLLGLGLLLLGGREAAALRARLSPSSLLIGAHTVVAAADGTLFVGSPGRVHVYRADGSPLRGFLVPVEGDFRLAIGGPDRLLIAAEAGGERLAYDFAGEPLSPDVAATAQPTPAGGDGVRYRIDGGDVVRVAGGSAETLVRGYPTHAAMLVHTLWTGLSLFLGGLLLVGGIASTGARRSA